MHGQVISLVLASLTLGCALFGCSLGDADSILAGAWQSDRERTLGELFDNAQLTEEQWRVLRDPKLFGNVLHIYHRGKTVSVYEGRCGPVGELDVTDSGPARVSIRYYDAFAKGLAIKTLSVEHDALYVPISLFGNQIREVFSRVSIEDVRERYPCTEVLFNADGGATV
jgi:hypothetical protein